MNKDQSGTGIVEILLIVVVVGILGFTGWFVWQSQQNASTTLDKANNSQDATYKKSSTQQGEDTKYLLVKEWNVKIPAGGVSGLSYTVSDNDTLHIQSSFMKSLCSASPSNAVVVQRGQASDLVANEIGVDQRSFETFSKESPQLTYAKLGSYYYVQPDYRGGSCATSRGTDLDKESADSAAIKAALKEMSAVN